MTPEERPNILVLLPHDLGDFLSCYGHSTVRSPHLDSLASQGVSFQNCFTPVPECTPSRGCMMTGLYPHQNGLMGLSNFGWSLRVPHLAERLQKGGYSTHLFGFQHETHKPAEALGYDHTHLEGSNEADVVCGNINAFLDSPAASSETPWFAYAGFRHVHRPWRQPTLFDPEQVEVPAWLPDHPEVRKDLARFYQDIEDLDAAVATVFDTLNRTGLGQDTLVIFTTDHGAAFPGAKATLYDPGVHLPLILHWSGHIEGGVVHEPLISNLDLCPTLLEIAGEPVPDGLAGRSFLPLLRGQDYEERDCVCGALFYDVAYDPMHYVRTKTHKYIRSFATTEEEAQGADPETLSTFAAGRWIRVDDFDVLTSPTWQALAPPESVTPPAEELYDLRTDPKERKNLAGNPDAREILQTMRARLQSMMEKSDSPLLHGHVQPPEKQRAAMRDHTPGVPLFAKVVAERQSLQ